VCGSWYSLLGNMFALSTPVIIRTCPPAAYAFALQVTKVLFDHVWGSWCSLLRDILGALPAALAAQLALAPPQLLLAFERWLLLLKVRQHTT
jgi:hypothetical protein